MCGAQFGAGFDAEFVNKPGTDVGEQLQRCSLFAVAVEGEHESGVQSLVQGFVHSQRPQVLACQLSPTKTLITHKPAWLCARNVLFRDRQMAIPCNCCG